jgi:hypothetical protein
MDLVFHIESKVYSLQNVSLIKLYQNLKEYCIRFRPTSRRDHAVFHHFGQSGQDIGRAHSVVARFEAAVDAAQVPPVFALILLAKVFRIILKNYYIRLKKHLMTKINCKMQKKIIFPKIQ